MKLPSGNFKGFSADEWFCIKLSFLFIWLITLPGMVLFNSTCPFPTGICKIYSFDPLFSTWDAPILIGALAVLGTLYLFEKKMLYTTFGMFALTVIIISHKESAGIFDRATLLSTVLGVQFIAYLQYGFNKKFDLQFFRVQYCVQIIAATYVLSGISKLSTSGIGWINGGELFPLQAVKTASFEYFTKGNAASLQHGYNMAYRLLAYKDIGRLFLAGTLFLELSCFLAAFSNRLRLCYGFGLLLMHIGINLVMSIFIVPVAWPMLIFYLNPVYWIKTKLAGLLAGDKKYT